MNRTIISRTLPALAVAMLLPLSAFASHQSTGTKSTTTPAVTQSHSTKQVKAKRLSVDINTASKEELMALPGIGDATADKIISGRPFKSKAELVKQHILTQAEYSKVSKQIIAKHAAGAKAEAAKTGETKAPEASSPETK